MCLGIASFHFLIAEILPEHLLHARHCHVLTQIVKFPVTPT